MGLKLSEAFKLLEDGEILTNGDTEVLLDQNRKIIRKHKGRIESICYGVTIFDEKWFENFHVYEKPKEKVQYYQVMVSYI